MSRPWSAIPAARSSAPVLRVKLITIVGLLVAATVSGPVSLVMALSRHTPAPVQVGSSNSMTTASAQIVAADYLNGRPSPVAVANGSTTDPLTVSSSFGYPSVGNASGRFPYQQLVFAGSSPRTDGTVSYELDYFLVESTSSLYVLTVSMLNTPSGPVLGALPSLTSYVPPTSNTTDPLDYSGDTGYVVGNGAYSAYSSYIQSAVTAWAAAYASGSQSGLQAVAKYAHQPYYPVLGGFHSAGVLIKSEVIAPAGLYVRVAVHLVRPHFSSVSEYDLLIAGGNTASPAVVSWGPAGSAPLSYFQ